MGLSDCTISDACRSVTPPSKETRFDAVRAVTFDAARVDAKVAESRTMLAMLGLLPKPERAPGTCQTCGSELTMTTIAAGHTRCRTCQRRPQ